MNLFNYDGENPNAEKYGNFYWGVILSDGRFLSLYAKNIEVIDGALVASREVNGSSEYDGMPQNLLAIAPGQWSSFFAANIMNGDPVCVDRTFATKNDAKLCDCDD